MARKTVVQVVDDVDGTTAETTIRFTWSGVAYEIDLSAKNARAFEAAVEPYLKAATRVTTGRRRSTRKATPQRPTLDFAAIRAWALDNGHKIADRGRVPTLIIDAYHAAQHVVDDRATATPARQTPANKTVRKSAAARKAASRTATKHNASAKKAAPRKAAAKTSK